VSAQPLYINGIFFFGVGVTKEKPRNKGGCWGVPRLFDGGACWALEALLAGSGGQKRKKR